MCSLMGDPLPSQKTKIIGAQIANTVVNAKAFDVQPPHLRYQPKMKIMDTIQAEKSATAPHEILSGSGLDGRSGWKHARTRGIANSASGTFNQKIHRHDATSFTMEVSSGVVGRVAYATTP